VAEHLALMDGLVVALQNGIRNIFAFTNSEKLYFQARAFFSA
jgi:N-acetylglutamate synthase-like GNAT family acetyltransferase